MHHQAAHDRETRRISLDTKAKVKIGALSRGGQGRGPEAVRAVDQDMPPLAVLAPAGILEVETRQLKLIFGTSRDTSDFVADCLDIWWADRHAAHPGVRRLLIDLDNGPEIASSRTQFMQRLLAFADRPQRTLELAYYPPYHRKYNLIERCWGILENPWNGTLLTAIEIALAWARTMTWHGIAPIMHVLGGVYETGVRLTKSAFRPSAARRARSDTLPKGSLVIQPASG